MKPLDAITYLRDTHDLISRNAPMPLYLRRWLCTAFAAWNGGSHQTLDQLLGLVSRSGGKLHARSKLPCRDQAIREFAEQLPKGQTSRARTLAEQFRSQRLGCLHDANVCALRQHYGRLPESIPQLSRILAGRTAASESLSRSSI